MYDYDAHTGPPRTLADRLRELNESLRSLAVRQKDAIARAVGSMASDAVRDAVRCLLGDKHGRSEDPDSFRGGFERQGRNSFADSDGSGRGGWGETTDARGGGRGG